MRESQATGPCKEVDSRAQKKIIPYVIIPRRVSASSCQSLEFFPYGTILLTGSVLANKFYRTVRKSFRPRETIFDTVPCSPFANCAHGLAPFARVSNLHLMLG